MKDYEQTLDECMVAENLQGGLLRYLQDGIIPGDFLQACISNDLKEALGLASTQEWWYVFNVVRFLYGHAPMNAWGSREKMLKYAEDTQNIRIAADTRSKAVATILKELGITEVIE